ncbi:MAG TPA: hypothetical protein PLX97_16320, partial [Gemmatales bacterium]|nr:hypothetical protein [Gemmatales bacterium]
EIGSQAIAWKVNEELQQPGVHHHLMSNEQATGYFTRKNGDDAGEFRLLSRDGTVTTNRHTMDKGFMPVGLRGGMLVSEKHTSREFPEWVQKLNEQFNTLCGRYAVSPLTYTMRYQDMATGALLTEFRSEPRNMNDYATRYNAGESRLAAIFIDQDHLRVEFSEVFPFWTSWSIALLAMAVTTVLGLGAVGWHRWKC